jgi:hypothetical protein
VGTSRSILRAHAYPFSDDDVDVLEGVLGTALIFSHLFLASLLLQLSETLLIIYSAPRFLSLDSSGVVVS